jgi:hypothetical protein
MHGFKRAAAAAFAAAAVITAMVLPGSAAQADAATAPKVTVTGAATSSAIPAGVPRRLSQAQRDAARSAAGTVAPQLACSSGYVCGKGANGNSFAYTHCDILYTLPNLIGVGPYNNNQTGHAASYYYDKAGNLIWISIAPDQGTVNWTPIWYTYAC